MGKNRRNYYRILHVQPDAPAEIIKSSYRTLMQKMRYHPDLGGDDWNAALLNEALAVLTDTTKRAAYDAEYERANAGQQQRKTNARRRKNAHANDTAHGTRPRPGPNKRHARGTGAYQAGFLSSCLFCGAHNEGRPSCSRCQSPLQQPPPPDRGSSDQRTFERRAIEIDVQVFVRWPQDHGFPAVVRDLTPRGMQIVLHTPLELNQIIKISGEFIANVSRVVNCKANEQGRGFNIGLAFLSLCFHNPRGGFVSEKA